MTTHTATTGGAFAHGSFIPSIEGLRALAVLAVLLFHLDIPGIAGGFLGVDLFFVISGFIISRNILTDLQGGTFSLKVFYLRRFRRLFPALLATVLLTLIVAALTLPPVEMASTAKSAIAALMSLANFHFWLESGYFDAAASTKPLLHTWSLSVEEQYYLFWPALLLLLSGSRLRTPVIVVLLLLSLLASLLLRNSMPDAIFFLLPFRLHQLMAGALIAALSLRLTGAVGSACSVLASIGFIATAVLLEGRLSPATGAAAVTCFGFFLLLGRESIAAKCLFGNRPMQWIGQRSYALYLVHWPIIVLYKFSSDFELDNTARAVLFVLSIGAAVALHQLVEKPFRQRKTDVTILQRSATRVTVATLLLTLSLAGLIWKFDGLLLRIDSRVKRIVDSVASEENDRRRAIRFGTCNLHEMHNFSDYDALECATPDPTRMNVLVLGDSMAADTYIMLSQTYPDIHFSQATAGACTAVLNISDVGGKYPTCEQLNKYRFSELVHQNTDLVVLASIWNEDRIPPLKDTVAYLHAQGKKVLIVGPRVHFRGSVPLLLSLQKSLDGLNSRLAGSVIREPVLLDQMRKAIPDAEIIDIASIQCTPGCDVIDGDRLLYLDERHFTVFGAKRIGERFKQRFDLPAFIRGRSSRDN